MLFLLLTILVFAALCYFKIIKPLKHWQEKEIVHKTPLPFFGNLGSVVCRIISLQDAVADVYNKFPNHRYVGFYEFGQPILIIRDLELIKQITIKDFEVFPDHRQMLPLNNDPLWEKNIFQMSAKDGWHLMRSTLSPAFTSSKMKMMFVLIQECSKQFVEFFKSRNRTISIDVKDAVARFTNDVIGSTAFGITCDSLKYSENEFYLMGKEASNFSIFKIIGCSISPKLMKLFGVKFFSNRVSKFFTKLIKESLHYRRNKNVVRPDMLHLILEAQKMADKGLVLSDESITAQALLFFTAGFESTSTVITFVLYYLAIHPDIQQKLHKEITAMTNGTKVTYQALFAMEYLDCVVSESLRLHLTIPTTDRVSTKPYTIEPVLPTEKPLYLDKGTTIYIPIDSIHHDKKYFPNPTKFDPERFSAKNRLNILPLSYLPFGAGPRNCIGSRFALMEIKLLIVEILQSFEVVPNEKTQIPLKLSKTNLNTIPNEGIWLSLKPRFH